MYGNFGGGDRDAPRRSFAPVNVGDELDVTIEAVGEKGDGVAKVKGFVLFVPNVKEGQNVKIRVTKVLRKVGFAEVIGEASGKAAAAPAKEAEPEDTEDFGEESEESEEEPKGENAPESDENLEEEIPGPEDDITEEK